MGIFLSKKERQEQKAFRDIVNKRATQSARQAYADEAVKVAAERARAKARAPTFGQKLSFVGSKLAQLAAKKVTQAPARRVSTRKVATRRAPLRRTARRKVRYAPIRRAPARRVARRKVRYAPIRRAPARRVARAPAQVQVTPKAPQSLNQAIYGGY